MDAMSDAVDNAVVVCYGVSAACEHVRTAFDCFCVAKFPHCTCMVDRMHRQRVGQLSLGSAGEALDDNRVTVTSALPSTLVLFICPRATTCAQFPAVVLPDSTPTRQAWT